MSGYVKGYMYITNIEEWRKVAGGLGAGGELYESTVNGITVLIPNASANGVIPKGKWWVTGDVSQYGEANSNEKNDSFRDEVANAYKKYVNRLIGPIAMEFWVNTWVYGGGKHNPEYGGSIDGMLKLQLKLSGETAFVASTPYAIPYTYYAPEYGCTDSSADNYKAEGPFKQILFTVTPILRGGACKYSVIPSVSLTASPSEILIGNSSTLTWSTANATSASIDGVSVNPAGGAKTVTPTQTTTYTLSATSIDSITRTTRTTVIVRNLPTAAISLSPSAIEKGSSSTLTWSTTNATNVNITNYGNNLNPNGSVGVNPKSQTTYTLNVTGYFGTVSSASTTLSILPERVPYINIDGTWAKVNKIYIKEFGVWNLCTSEYVREDLGWKQILRTETPTKGTVTTKNVGGSIQTNVSGVVQSATTFGTPVPNTTSRYYEIRLLTDVSNINVTNIGDYTAGGVYDPGIYLFSVSKISAFTFRITFRRSSPPDDAGYTTFVDTFTIEI